MFEAQDKEALQIGEDLIKKITLKGMCEPAKRYPKELKEFRDVVVLMQKALKADFGISFTDSGKSLIAMGLAGWAVDESQGRVKQQ